MKLIEEHIGAKIEDVAFKDVPFIDQMAPNTKESKNVILSLSRVGSRSHAECFSLL